MAPRRPGHPSGIGSRRSSGPSRNSSSRLAPSRTMGAGSMTATAWAWSPSAKVGVTAAMRPSRLHTTVCAAGGRAVERAGEQHRDATRGPGDRLEAHPAPSIDAVTPVDSPATRSATGVSTSSGRGPTSQDRRPAPSVRLHRAAPRNVSTVRPRSACQPSVGLHLDPWPDVDAEGVDLALEERLRRAAGPIGEHRPAVGHPMPSPRPARRRWWAPRRPSRRSCRGSRPRRCPGALTNIGTHITSGWMASTNASDSSPRTGWPGWKEMPWSAVTTRSVSSKVPVARIRSSRSPTSRST